MNDASAKSQIEVLRAYADGQLGTRETIEKAGLDDYADLLIAMVKADLDFPRPPESAARDARIARATAILQPLLRRHVD